MSAIIDRARELLRKIQEPTYGLPDLTERRMVLICELAFEVAEPLIAEAGRLREALQFYADPEAWSALPHAPIIGHRWDRWCYGGEVAQWALEGQSTARKGFEGEPQPS